MEMKLFTVRSVGVKLQIYLMNTYMKGIEMKAWSEQEAITYAIRYLRADRLTPFEDILNGVCTQLFPKDYLVTSEDFHEVRICLDWLLCEMRRKGMVPLDPSTWSYKLNIQTVSEP